MLRRAFFASAVAAIAALLGSARRPAPARIIERRGAGGWAPVWLAEAHAGDRVRFRHDHTYEYVLERTPAANPDGSYDVVLGLAPDSPHAKGRP